MFVKKQRIQTSNLIHIPKYADNDPRVSGMHHSTIIKSILFFSKLFVITN